MLITGINTAHKYKFLQKTNIFIAIPNFLNLLREGRYIKKYLASNSRNLENKAIVIVIEKFCIVMSLTC